MLRVTIDLVPYGRERDRRTIGVVEIVNDGSGVWECGNYRVRATGETVAGCELTGRVTDFPRTRLSAFHLLQTALAAVLKGGVAGGDAADGRPVGRSG